ncbi:MAG: carboxypeptidase regulatory-like domain-containing protein, partial [Bifidobacteriaceae bacterium]|nr:carboxypeptidase regulatory-like domain-containing protein [Bifidobacteriaceae bacterium]
MHPTPIGVPSNQFRRAGFSTARARLANRRVLGAIAALAQTAGDGALAPAGAAAQPGASPVPADGIAVLVQDDLGPLPDVSVTVLQSPAGGDAAWENTGDPVDTDASGIARLPEFGPLPYCAFYFSVPSQAYPGTYSQASTGEYSLPVDVTAWGSYPCSGLADGQAFTLTSQPRMSGAVLAQPATGAPVPVGRAAVQAYAWDEAAGWGPINSSALTRPNGVYSMPSVSEGLTITLWAGHPAHQPLFLGGSPTFPAAPSAANSFQHANGGTVPDIVFTGPKSTALGAVAGRDLDYCQANVLPAEVKDRNYNVSTASTAIRTPDSVLADLGFQLKFYNEPHSQVWVHRSGALTFGDQSYYYPTEEGLLANDGRLQITPFSGMADTMLNGAGTVTYGASPDGKTFCATWNDVGAYYARPDQRNTFQVLLTSRTGAAGRDAGDFDITFNYDQIEWDSLWGPGGATAASAGYSVGEGGLPDTFAVIDGSGTPGALLDSGPKALIAGSHNSPQPGRYIYEILGSQVEPTTGAVQGHVYNALTSAPLANATVVINGPRKSYWTTTDAAGLWSIDPVRHGDYSVNVTADGAFHTGYTTVTVEVGATATAPDVLVKPIQPLPLGGGVTLSNGTYPVSVNANGVPTVYWTQPISVTIADQCVGGTGTYQFTVGSRTIAHGDLAEAPPGTYSFTIAPVYPASGYGELTWEIACPGAPVSRGGFDVYIDPSGQVVDQFGSPVAGASVVLSRADAPEGPFEPVADGSSVM